WTIIRKDAASQAVLQCPCNCMAHEAAAQESSRPAQSVAGRFLDLARAGPDDRERAAHTFSARLHEASRRMSEPKAAARTSDPTRSDADQALVQAAVDLINARYLENRHHIAAA